ncbi:MAG: AAA family ATPase [Sandarakinorhabdus sp.]
MADRLEPLAASLSSAAPVPPRSTNSVPGGGTVEQPLSPLTCGEFLAKEFPPREMLLAPILPQKSISMLFGPRGLGKTFMAMGIALAVASGGTFLGWTAPVPAKVLYIDGEMPASLMQDRVAKAVRHLDRPDLAKANLFILSADEIGRSLPDLGSEAGRKLYAPLLEQVDLIIIDNLSTLCRTGKENEAEGWDEIQAWVLVQRIAGRSVLFIHHAGKGGEQRGTSKREDIMDTVIKLSRPLDYGQSQGARFRVEFSKARGIFGKDVEPFEATLKDDQWTTSAPVNDREEEIAALHDQGLSVRKIAKQTGMSATSVHRMLTALQLKAGEGEQSAQGAML